MHSGLVLTQDMLIVLGLTGFIIAMLMFERIRADAVSLLALVILGFTGIVSETDLFKGFAGNAVISVMASMILSTALDRTGVLNRLADRFAYSTDLSAVQVVRAAPWRQRQRGLRASS